LCSSAAERVLSLKAEGFEDFFYVSIGSYDPDGPLQNFQRNRDHVSKRESPNLIYVVNLFSKEGLKSYEKDFYALKGYLKKIDTCVPEFEREWVIRSVEKAITCAELTFKYGEYLLKETEKVVFDEELMLKEKGEMPAASVFMDGEYVVREMSDSALKARSTVLDCIFNHGLGKCCLGRVMDDNSSEPDWKRFFVEEDYRKAEEEIKKVEERVGRENVRSYFERMNIELRQGGWINTVMDRLKDTPIYRKIALLKRIKRYYLRTNKDRDRFLVAFYMDYGYIPEELKWWRKFFAIAFINKAGLMDLTVGDEINTGEMLGLFEDFAMLLGQNRTEEGALNALKMFFILSDGKRKELKGGKFVTSYKVEGRYSLDDLTDEIQYRHKLEVIKKSVSACKKHRAFVLEHSVSGEIYDYVNCKIFENEDEWSLNFGREPLVEKMDCLIEYEKELRVGEVVAQFESFN
jgi:hypothetical protein